MFRSDPFVRKTGISILVRKERNGAYQGFTSIGHAGYAKQGKDIVCAAVSILVFTTVNALEEIAGEKLNVVQNKDAGLLDCRFPEGIHEKGILLMDTMLLGLKDIQNTYGRKYIELKFEEV
ncbi:MAG: ribosomal-processing cysteine protease Prp [Clostridiales bacterium]|nr:ribosomal-processing cysteine protease Prp [Clostridiales bacterium]